MKWICSLLLLSLLNFILKIEAATINNATPSEIKDAFNKRNEEKLSKSQSIFRNKMKGEEFDRELVNKNKGKLVEGESSNAGCENREKNQGDWAIRARGH